jgi:hypothetical protein
VIALLKECKSGYNRDACTLMFITALFTIAKVWKQYRCPTTDKKVIFHYLGEKILKFIEEKRKLYLYM